MCEADAGVSFALNLISDRFAIDKPTEVPGDTCCAWVFIYVHLIPWHIRICQSAHSHLWIAISLVHCTILFPARGTWKGIGAEWMPLVHCVLPQAWKATTVNLDITSMGWWYLHIQGFVDQLTLISGLQMSLVHCKLQFCAWPYLFTNLKNDFDSSIQTSWSFTVKKFSFRMLPNSCQWISSDLHLLCCNLGALALHTVGYSPLVSFGGAVELCPCIWFCSRIVAIGMQGLCSCLTTNQNSHPIWLQIWPPSCKQMCSIIHTSAGFISCSMCSRSYHSKQLTELFLWWCSKNPCTQESSNCHYYSLACKVVILKHQKHER